MAFSPDSLTVSSLRRRPVFSVPKSSTPTTFSSEPPSRSRRWRHVSSASKSYRIRLSSTNKSRGPFSSVEKMCSSKHKFPLALELNLLSVIKQSLPLARLYEKRFRIQV